MQDGGRTSVLNGLVLFIKPGELIGIQGLAAQRSRPDRAVGTLRRQA